MVNKLIWDIVGSWFYPFIRNQRDFHKRRDSLITGMVALVLCCGVMLSSCKKAEKRYDSPFSAVFREKLQRAKSFFDIFQVVDSVDLEFGKNSIITYLGSVAVSHEGRIVVADLGSGGRVLLFDNRGRFIREISTSGRGPGEVLSPHVTFTDGDTLLISDSRNEWVAIYDSAGNFLRDFRVSAQPLGAQLFNKSIYVVSAPLVGEPIWRYSLNGTLLTKFGRVPDSPRRVGIPIKGGSISVYDGKYGKYVYYVHPAEYNIQIFTPTGELVREVGAPAGSQHRNLEEKPTSASPQSMRDWLRTWDPVNTIMALANGVVLVVYQDKRVPEDKIETVIDLYDPLGNLLVSGLHTTYLPICTDYNGRLYCLQKGENYLENKNPRLYILIFAVPQ